MALLNPKTTNPPQACSCALCNKRVKVPAGISEYRLQDPSPLNRNSAPSPMPLCAADPGEQKKKGRRSVPKTKAVTKTEFRNGPYYC